VIVTVNVPVPWFPDGSDAIAVQTLVVSAVTAAAVNIFDETSKLPPFVQVTVGPDAIPLPSVAVSVDEAVVSEITVSVDGLKDTIGDVVSAAGGVGVEVPLLPPPPPQADKSSTDAIESVERWVRFK